MPYSLSFGNQGADLGLLWKFPALHGGFEGNVVAILVVQGVWAPRALPILRVHYWTHASFLSSITT